MDIKAEYEKYLKEWNDSRFEILYDEDERPMMVRERSVKPALDWREWLDSEMERAIEEEEYLYAAGIRDAINEYENETQNKKSDENNWTECTL